MGIQDKRDFTHDILKHSTLGLALNQEGETIQRTCAKNSFAGQEGLLWQQSVDGEEWEYLLWGDEEDGGGEPHRWKGWYWGLLKIGIDTKKKTQLQFASNRFSPLSNCRCSTLWWRWRWSPGQRGSPWLLPRSLLPRWWSCSYFLYCLFLVFCFNCFMFELCADHLSELHLLPQLQPGKPHRRRWFNNADQHYSEWSSVQSLHNWSSINLAFIKFYFKCWMLIPFFEGLWPEGILATGRRRWTIINSQHLRVNKCRIVKFDVWCSFSTSRTYNFGVDKILICRVNLQRRSRIFPFPTTFDSEK